MTSTIRPRARRAGIAALALSALLGAAAGCTGGADAASPPSPASDGATGGPVDTADLPEALTGQRPDWALCPEPAPEQSGDAVAPDTLPDGTPWECATVTVPRDYADPEGETLETAVIRARSSAAGEDRIGSLIFNFGGPGGSGVITLPAFANDYETLRSRYDLVSFDPRGVGDSSGLVCMDDAELDDYFAADIAPGTEEEERAYAARLSSFAGACEAAAGPLLPYLTTENTARDLDLLREVLGDERLHYLGVSYGTELGAVYAHLFPGRVGRAVLDAVVDPTQDDLAAALGQARGFQRALGAYAEDCVAGDACPLGGSAEEAEDAVAGLLRNAREDPVPTQDPGRDLTQSLAWAGIAQSLYSEDFWPFLTQGLEDALDPEAPDGTILLALGDAMNGRATDGTYSTLQSSLVAIHCADSSARYSAEDVAARLPEFRQASPVFGEAMAWSLLTCSAWPVDGAFEHPRVGAEGAAEILLIGTTGDPATPYEGTARMRDALGEGVGVMITYDGEGHGAYTSGDRCVTRATDAYLLDGKVPEDGLVCD